MTDNEILEILNTPYNRKWVVASDGNDFIRVGDLLDLINRQKAEIERLQKAGEEAVSFFARMESLYKIKCKELEVAKSGAIKEFAERLKAEASPLRDIVTGIPCSYTISSYQLDNLVKEMTDTKKDEGK